MEKINLNASQTKPESLLAEVRFSRHMGNLVNNYPKIVKVLTQNEKELSQNIESILKNLFARYNQITSLINLVTSKKGPVLKQEQPSKNIQKSQEKVKKIQSQKIKQAAPVIKKQVVHIKQQMVESITLVNIQTSKPQQISQSQEDTDNIQHIISMLRTENKEPVISYQIEDEPPQID